MTLYKMQVIYLLLFSCFAAFQSVRGDEIQIDKLTLQNLPFNASFSNKSYLL